MSFNINLYTLTKDSNSTKQPTGTGTELACNILSPADIIAPLVEIKHTDPTAFNYAYIAAFHRYYFIEGMTYNEGLWILSLRCDVLATYKTEIGAQSLYVLRSASESDGTIADTYYPIKASISYTEELANPFYHSTPYTNGFYVVNVLGPSVDGQGQPISGTSTLWKMSPSVFRDFITGVFAAIDGFQPVDIFDAIKKLLHGSPTKLVSSAMWFPGQINFTTSATQRVIVGSWDSGVDAQLITDPIYVDSSMWLDINRHPQAATRGAYLNMAPYSIYTLTLPLFGAINLDPALMQGASQVHLYLRVDAVSGVATVEIDTGGTRPMLGYLTAQMGVAMPLSGQESGASVAGGVVSTLAGVAGAIVTGGAAAPVIGAVSAGIGTAVSAMSGASFSSGSSGSILGPTATWRLNSTHFTVADADDTHNGRPLMQNKTINTLSGFVMVQKGDVPIAGTSQEADEIRSLLEGGFYYE